MTQESPVQHEKDPVSWAAEDPDRVALVMGGSGETVTYAQLADRASRLTHLLRASGLQPGDVVALLSENGPRFHEVYWACRFGGFAFTPVNSHLGAAEVAYILNDCRARLLVASASLPVAAQLPPALVPTVGRRLAVYGSLEGYEDYVTALADQPTDPPEPGPEGSLLQYSSGTTGRPKGIWRAARATPTPYDADPVVGFLRAIGAREGTVYLSPAPLYHSAPIGWTMGVLRMGGTVVVMERFTPQDALRLIEAHRVQTAQFVPTMFVRLLKLPPADRERYDLRSLESVVHAAAPCPVEVKRAMIAWWGPIVHEYWSSSEGAGFTFITAADWLEHPGSVGRSLVGTLHICDDDGRELPPGEPGLIWAEGTADFTYLGEAAGETAPRPGWRTVGDVGWLDAEGYLYLTDRASFMIISGGVNIYPQEAENALIEHPLVLDAAVIGVPDEELGEQVRAVVQLVDPAAADPALGDALVTWCRERLAAYKCPRQVDFTEQLPRTETGKLLKRQLRERYA